MHCRPTHYFLIKNSQKIIFKKLSVAAYRLSLAVQRGNSATVLGTISSIIKGDKLQSLGTVHKLDNALQVGGW